MVKSLSTTVEIILYYLTYTVFRSCAAIYNSRNYSILLNNNSCTEERHIYNSRNYSILLNTLTLWKQEKSTTVEIILYYLTGNLYTDKVVIYNSRNYSILLNRSFRSFIRASTTVEIILYYLTFKLQYIPGNLQQ